MPVDLGFLGPKWIVQLTQQLTKIRGDRRDQIDRLNDLFAVDPEVLAKRYVEPDVQYLNPLVHRGEAPPSSAEPQPLREGVNRFLDSELEKKDGRHVLFLLGDAGMGKTSALLMLKLTHLTSFWPEIHDFQLFKLGPGTLGNVRKLPNKRRTVLLLDSLDEDPEAIGLGQLDDRLLALVQETKPFRQVIITCRTQFFPAIGKATIDGARVAVQNYNCNLLYLSPFRREKVHAYLHKVYPNRGWWKLMEWFRQGNNPTFRKAEALVMGMGELRMRPLLLSYIGDLMEHPGLQDASGETVVWQIYDALVDEWLRREVEKLDEMKRRGEDGALPVPPNRDELRRACQLLAVEMIRTQAMEISRDDLARFLETADVERLNALQLGGRALLNKDSDEAVYRFSHRTVQEFLVVQHLHTEVDRGGDLEPVAGTEEMFRFHRAGWLEADTPSWPRVLVLTDRTFDTVYTDADGLVDLWREIPAGEGWIGSPKGVGHDDERPRHRIEVTQPFWMAAVPVTNAQYAAFDPNHESVGGPDHPAVNVSWDEAMEFCKWLDDEQGLSGARLPTEEEWEYACRAGSKTHYWNGDSESDLDAVGWYKENSGGSTHAVGEKPANPLGLYDVHGNVWEWTCTPWNAERYKGRSTETPFSVDPSAQPDDLAGRPSARRVFRGGSFVNSANGARSAYRGDGGPWSRWSSLGFRVVLPLPPAGGR